jgi:hypothetical protein
MQHLQSLSESRACVLTAAVAVQDRIFDGIALECMNRIGVLS